MMALVRDAKTGPGAQGPLLWQRALFWPCFLPSHQEEQGTYRCSLFPLLFLGVVDSNAVPDASHLSPPCVLVTHRFVHLIMESGSLKTWVDIDLLHQSPEVKERLRRRRRMGLLSFLLLLSLYRLANWRSAKYP